MRVEFFDNNKLENNDFRSLKKIMVYTFLYQTKER